MTHSNPPRTGSVAAVDVLAAYGLPAPTEDAVYNAGQALRRFRSGRDKRRDAYDEAALAAANDIRLLPGRLL